MLFEVAQTHSCCDHGDGDDVDYVDGKKASHLVFQKKREDWHHF